MKLHYKNAKAFSDRYYDSHFDKAITNIEEDDALDNVAKWLYHHVKKIETSNDGSLTFELEPEAQNKYWQFKRKYLLTHNSQEAYNALSAILSPNHPSSSLAIDNWDNFLRDSGFHDIRSRMQEMFAINSRLEQHFENTFLKIRDIEKRFQLDSDAFEKLKIDYKGNPEEDVEHRISSIFQEDVSSFAESLDVIKKDEIPRILPRLSDDFKFYLGLFDPQVEEDYSTGGFAKSELDHLRRTRQLRVAQKLMEVYNANRILRERLQEMPELKDLKSLQDISDEIDYFMEFTFMDFKMSKSISRQ